MTDEVNLINSSQKGDLEAFNQLVLKYQGLAFNLALRFLNDEDAAADASQVAFISAFQNMHTFRGGSFKAWLLRIVTNKCYDELRRQKRKPAQSLEAFDSQTDQEIEDPVWMADDADLPEDQVAQKELDRVIQRCIEALPTEFRAVVLLVDVNGLDYKQTAKAARVPVGTVRSRLARARRRLQTCLQAAWELLPEKYRLKSESKS